MAESPLNEYCPDHVSAPGETLLETLEAVGMTQADLAKRTGKTRKHINEIVKGKAPITPRMALDLERVLGIPAAFWNNRERQYQEALARKQEREELEGRVEWLARLPLRAMAARGWIALHKDKVQQVREALNFFGISSPDQWERFQSNHAAKSAFRRSRVFQTDPGALMAWLRAGELEARQIPSGAYNAAAFRSALRDARGLTALPPEVFLPELKNMCAACGVAVVFVPELPGTRVSGATRWLTPTRALIQLSFRYKTDDHFWFTFFHEAGHILLHGKSDIFLEEDACGEDREREANAFAANILIPEHAFARLRQLGRIDKDAIVAFARDIGIAPGIVVGRLQHEKILDHRFNNDLKKKLDWHPKR